MNTHEEELLLSAYLDGELTDDEKTRLDSHLSACESCRLDLESLRGAKRLLAGAPRRVMPPDLIADLETRFTPPSWTRRLGPRLTRPQLWIPAGAMAAAALTISLWLGMGTNDPEQSVPIEPLLAAHERYTAESLVPQGSLVASNYSVQTTANDGEIQNQEIE